MYFIYHVVFYRSTMPCPGCKLAGRKDNACTHMTCSRCHTSWCYVCGLSSANCNKAPPEEGQPTDNMCLHNKDWAQNTKRCPMYLREIPEVDPAWHNWRGGRADDEFCLAYFHQYRTIKLMQVRQPSRGGQKVSFLGLILIDIDLF